MSAIETIEKFVNYWNCSYYMCSIFNKAGITGQHFFYKKIVFGLKLIQIEEITYSRSRIASGTALTFF